MNMWVPKQMGPKALFLPMGGTRQKPNVIIPTYGTDKSEMAELVDALCEKRGIPKSERPALIAQAEMLYEQRIKIWEARQEIRRRLEGQLPRMKKKGGRWVSSR